MSLSALTRRLIARPRRPIALLAIAFLAANLSSVPVLRVRAAESGAARALQPAVLTVTIASVERAAHILRQLYPKARIITDRPANALIVYAPPADVAAMRTVLQGIDTANPTKPTTEAIALRTSDPRVLATKLHELFPAARVTTGPNHSIIVEASPTDMAQIKALVAAIDQATPAAAPAATEAVTLSQARSADVVRAISSQFKGVRATAVGPAVIIAGAPEDVARAKALIATIDVPQEGSAFTQIYRLRFVDAGSVGNLIARSFANVRVSVEKELNAITVAATREQHVRIADAIQQLDGGRVVGPDRGPAVAQPGTASNQVAGPNGTNLQVITLKAAVPAVGGAVSTTANDIANTVQQSLGRTAPDLKITVPANSTQLVLSGNPDTIRAAKDLIDQLDVAQKLVVLDTEILEVDENSAKNLGLQLTQPVLSTTYSETTPPPNPATGIAPPLLGLQALSRTPLSLGLTLNLLVQKGNARILADPRITTISGRTATIRAGDNISILTTTGGGAGTVATTQLQTFQTGVSLDITPVINQGNFITVTLHPTVNSLSSVSNGIPQISTRDTQTTVAMQEDQTLVIGGLIEDNQNSTNLKVPGLGDLPIVGKVFRNSQVNHTRNELIITVTPHIVNPGSPAPPPAPGALPTPAPLPTLAPTTMLPTARPVALRPRVGRGRKGAVAIAGEEPQPEETETPEPAPQATRNPNVLFGPSPTPTPGNDVFTYGQIPKTTTAGQFDPPKIFQARYSPATLRSGAAVQVLAVTTSNVNTVTVGTSGNLITLSQGRPGFWSASYTFNPLGLAPGPLQLTLTATKLDGSAVTLPIPITLQQ